MSLKTRITLWSVTTTVAVAIILIAVALIAERVTRQRVADAVLLGNTLIWEQLLADQLSRVKANKAEFDNEFDLRAAIKRGDRAAIQDYADRYVNLTGDSGSYDLLQILSLDQDPLYNSQPNLSLVRLSSMLNRVIADQKVHTGVLVTVDGTPMTVAAFPVASRGKLKGLALYAKRLDDVLTRLSARSGAGTALVGDKPYAVAALPEFDQLSRLLPGTGDRTVRTVSAGHRDYVFSAQPVADATGVPVAHLVVARDDTEALAQLRTFSRGAYLVVALTIIGGVLAMFFAVKRYLAPLQLAAATAGRVAKGDLTTRVPVTGVAEIAALEHAMDDMVLNLRDMMGSIGNISGQIRTSSDDLNHCVEQARTGVADQQVRSEAISHSLHEMSASVDEEARVTEQAAGAAVAMQTEAEQGHALLQQNLTGAQQLAAEMDDVSRTIEGLNTQAESVTDILAVIKGIAEQTNLLALNAAIEAARAGDQGRGFAVVADEVRALAGRTQHSTTEIADIIDRLVSGAADSVRRIHGARERVRDNANQADSALARFAGIREQVSELAGINQTIAAAVEEQSAVSKEIAANMRGIQQLGDANNQRSDYLFNTAQSLDELAGALASVTGHFRYESDDVPEAIVR